jgi:hypothetical protein
MDAVLPGFDLGQWNEYHVVARGNRMVLRINGKITTELEDREKDKARAAGVLAVPVIPQPMKVQYKDIHLKVLGGT